MGVLTKDDFTKLEKRFATKDDLRAMEARAAERFATKDDLAAMEVRIEKKFASKSDFTDLGGRFDHAVGVLERKIERSEDRITGAIKEVVKDLARRAEVDEVRSRVARLEQRAG